MKPIKRRTRPVKAKCMNCTAVSTITDKSQPCPVCALCGSLAWQDVKGLK
jgi:ribosomal protein S27E